MCTLKKKEYFSFERKHLIIILKLLDVMKNALLYVLVSLLISKKCGFSLCLDYTIKSSMIIMEHHPT